MRSKETNSTVFIVIEQKTVVMLTKVVAVETVRNREVPVTLKVEPKKKKSAKMIRRRVGEKRSRMTPLCSARAWEVWCWKD